MTLQIDSRPRVNKLLVDRGSMIVPQIGVARVVRERERHFIYCRCLQRVTLALGYYNRHIHYIHSGDG